METFDYPLTQISSLYRWFWPKNVSVPSRYHVFVKRLSHGSLHILSLVVYALVFWRMHVDQATVVNGLECVADVIVLFRLVANSVAFVCLLFVVVESFEYLVLQKRWFHPLKCLDSPKPPQYLLRMVLFDLKVLHSFLKCGRSRQSLKWYGIALVY